MTHSTLVNLDLDPLALGLATDLYELTMMAGYQAAGVDRAPAVFEMFVRRLPKHRSFLVFAGLEQALDALVRLRFSDEQVAAIRTWPVFRTIDPSFFGQLASFRFTGDVWAVPEGTIVFANEPFLRVEGPLAEVQLVETLLLAQVGYATSVASKAARIIQAAQGRGVIDLGARRGHGLAASMIAARSAYLAGFAGTSQAEAARRLGIPAFGTMAHSWVQTFGTETQAFEAFAQSFPNATLLVDTYNTARGVRRAAAIDPPVRAVRIDSAPLAANAREARATLDGLDRSEVRILASGDLDEYQIADLVAQDAPIDDFGVGTELITCSDAPSLSLVYKLTELAGEGKIKLSAGKRGIPFAKQVYRRPGPDGVWAGDEIVRAGATGWGEPLLKLVMRGGQLVTPGPSLDQIRAHCQQQVAAIPASLRSLDDPREPYPITVAGELLAAGQRLTDQLAAEEGSERRPSPGP